MKSHMHLFQQKCEQGVLFVLLLIFAFSFISITLFPFNYASATVCECTSTTGDTVSCSTCRDFCVTTGGTMTGFSGITGTACDAAGAGILVEASCACADGREAPISDPSLASCCTACSTAGVRAESVQYSGATEACPAPATEPAGGGGADTSAPPPPITLYNPLGGDVTIAEFIGRGVRAVIGIVGALALLMFIYGGIVWMTAGGSQDRITSAKNILKNSFIGIMLIFFSYTIISIFFSFLNG